MPLAFDPCVRHYPETLEHCFGTTENNSAVAYTATAEKVKDASNPGVVGVEEFFLSSSFDVLRRAAARNQRQRWRKRRKERGRMSQGRARRQLLAVGSSLSFSHR